MKRRESEGGQKFLSPNPLPFCPYEQNLFEKFSGILFKNSSSLVQNTPPRKKHHLQHGVFFLEELGVAPGKGVGETGVSPLRKTLKTEGFLERC